MSGCRVRDLSIVVFPTLQFKIMLLMLESATSDLTLNYALISQSVNAFLSGDIHKKKYRLKKRWLGSFISFPFFHLYISVFTFHVIA